MEIWSSDSSMSFFKRDLTRVFTLLTQEAPRSGQALLTGMDKHNSAISNRRGKRYWKVARIFIRYSSTHSVGVWAIRFLFTGGVSISAGILSLMERRLYLNFVHSHISSSFFFLFDFDLHFLVEMICQNNNILHTIQIHWCLVHKVYILTRSGMVILIGKLCQRKQTYRNFASEIHSNTASEILLQKFWQYEIDFIISLFM